MRLLILLILTSSSFAFASDCSKQKDDLGFFWTKGNLRKQGGGWVWFLGKSKSSDKETSTLLAEGRALHNLFKECGVIPKNTKFIERCNEEKDGYSITYVRASIKEKECNPKSAKNLALEKIYEDFKKLKYRQIGQKQSSSIICNASNISKCFNYLDFYWSGSDVDNASKTLKSICMNSSIDDCQKAANSIVNENDFPVKEKLWVFKFICKKYRSDASSKMSSKAGSACSEYLRFNDIKKDMTKTEKYNLAKAVCRIDEKHCFSYASILLDEKNGYDKAMPYYKRACDQGDEQSCGNLGYIYYYIKNNKKRGRDLYKFACDNLDRDACYNIACDYALSKNKEKAIKALEHYLSLVTSNGIEPIWDQILSDKDLDSIRNTNEFKTLIKKYKALSNNK